MPIAQVLSDLASESPDSPAVTFGDRTVTRGELEVAANALAAAYDRLGVGHGDTVTITLPNGIEFVAATMAVWKLGAVPQPLSSQLPSLERRAIVDLATPRLIIGVPPEDHPGVATIPVGFVADPFLELPEIPPDRVSPAWKIMTSGGSTGRPKLIVSGTNGEISPDTGRVFGMRPGGVVLVPGPVYHNAPFQWLWFGLWLGGHVVLLPKFDALDALDAIERRRVEVVNLVPTMMSRMLRAMEASSRAFDLSSLKVVWHMGAPCPPWVKQAWIELLGGDRLVEVYGGAEGSAVTMITGTEWLTHRGSVGRPVSGEMRILDPNFAELPAGQVGEIFMRRPKGAPATYRYVGAEARERDGWESLGDLGWMDDDGYVYISDRRVDMIVAGGANIYPAEVEAALSEHPGVESAIAVGLPDADLGQRVHAVVQARGEVTEAELLAFLASRLVRYKIPRSIRFVDEPLRDDAGKVRRSAIREREIELQS